MDSFDASADRRLSRRSFVSSLGAATGALALSGAGASTAQGATANDELGVLSFYSTASQVSADYGPLADEEHVVAWASDEAYVTVTSDGTDEDDVVFYEDDRIPLISRDGRVTGFGSAGFLSDERGGLDADNEEFVLNVWDDLLGPESTVLWDESHRQYWDLASHEIFRRYAEDNGYELHALEEFEAAGTALEFYSTASQRSPDGDALTEDELGDGLAVLAWAEPTATNGDQTGDDAYRYGDDERIPLITRDDRVVGFGAPFAADDSGHDENRGFVLGVWDDAIDGETVYWDESHDQYYGSWQFEELIADAEAEGYLIEPTDGLLAVLRDETENADAIVVTTPAEPFSDAVLAALEAFVDDGGALLLHDQSDFGGHDRTANLNAIAERLDLAFRFNGGQVEDEVHNAGPEYEPIATDFSPEFDYVEPRTGADIEFDRDGMYDGRIVWVLDGDTFEVEFDTEYGYREVVRCVGVDTAETPPAENDPEEWFGIPDDANGHLEEWGGRASDYALDRMAPDGADVDERDVEGRHVKLTFDAAEPLRGNYGRLLGYLRYDPDECEADFDAGSFSAEYNREIVADGYARVYSSGFSTHDELAALEEDALAAGRGVWEAADFDALSEIRNDPVEELFVPSARSIRRDRGNGRLDGRRVAVSASPSAEQHLEADGVAYDDVPLVAVDDRRRVTLVGGVLIDEEYEEDEEFGVDTSGYGNFPFLANLIDHLSATEGNVILAGGQGQFGIEGSISLERCRYYLRYLEGVGVRLRQINDLAGTLPEEDETPRAVLLTAPARAFGFEERLALRWFRNRGGAVVLLGSADASPDHTCHLNDLAADLGTDLRFNADRVVDEERNLGDDPSVLETAAFDDSFPLFDAYDPSNGGDGGRDCPGNSDGAPGRADEEGCPGNSANAPGRS